MKIDKKLFKEKEMSEQKFGSTEDFMHLLELSFKNMESDIKYVERQRTDPRDLPKEKYPGVFINYLRTDKEKVEDAENVYKNILTVVLVGFVWAEEGESLGQKLNDFIEGIKEILEVLKSKDSVKDFFDIKIDTIVTDGGTYHPQGQFMITLTVEFQSKENI